MLKKLVFVLTVSFCFSGLGLAEHQSISKNSSSGLTYLQKLSGDDSATEKNTWDRLYRKKEKEYVFGKEPAEYLEKNIKLLPVGQALDIAMGEGRNAVYLAKKGFDVLGVDISEVGIRKAKRLARENHVRIRTEQADLNKYQIKPNSYDVIVVFYYLQRSLFPQIKKGLKKGGIVIFETNTMDQLKYDRTMNKAYLLQKGELKHAFSNGFKIIKYSETDNGKHAVASLIAKKL